MRSRPTHVPRLGAAIVTLIVVNVGIELTLAAADAGLIGSARWRAIAYQNGAFWAGLLHGWRPNYPAQPWLMFLSYAVLHGGMIHLAGNMLILWGLGRILRLRIGPAGFFAVYILSAVGGALCFGLLSQSPQPMVGASGALFGLVGCWQYWRWSLRRRAGRSLWPVWQALGWLVLLNAVFWVILDGLLAWETHLGGFVAGWLTAAALDWRSGQPDHAKRRPRRTAPDL
jgi:membrane associated rhomboid family serine protease